MIKKAVSLTVLLIQCSHCQLDMMNGEDARKDELDALETSFATCRVSQLY